MNGFSEENWQRARLIPTAGISGIEEQENRATSALLAVMNIVEDFSKAILVPLGAPSPNLRNMETFLRVPFKLNETYVEPDGVIRITRGSRTWVALVEVKTKDSSLSSDQLENYLDVAKENGFDCLITISNEISSVQGVHPTQLDKRKLKKVSVHHLSWSQILQIAILYKNFKGIKDTEQSWILGELIRYLEEPASGALAFKTMGPNWVEVREAVSAGTLRPRDKNTEDVVMRFDALINYAAFKLSSELGEDVVPVLSRLEKSNPHARTSKLIGSMVDKGELSAELKIPNVVSPLLIEVNLKAKIVTCSFAIDAPKTKKNLTRINWLLKQLKDADSSIRVEAFVPHDRQGTAELLKDLRLSPEKLIIDKEKEIKSFKVAYSTVLGIKQGDTHGSFISSVLAAVNESYKEIGQHLKLWVEPPAKLKEIKLPPRPEILTRTPLTPVNMNDTPPFMENPSNNVGEDLD